MNSNDLDAITQVGGWSILAAASRSILSEDRRSIVGFLRGLVMAVFVGTMTNLLVKDYSFTPAVQGAIVGITSFIADDILLLILVVSSAIRKNPKQAVTNFVDYIFKR